MPCSSLNPTYFHTVLYICSMCSVSGEQLLKAQPLPGAQGWVTCCIMCSAEGSCIPFTLPGSAPRARLSIADVRLRPMLIRQPAPISIKAGREPSPRRSGRLGVVQNTGPIWQLRPPHPQAATKPISPHSPCSRSFQMPTTQEQITNNAWLWRRMTPPKLQPCPRAPHRKDPSPAPWCNTECIRTKDLHTVRGSPRSWRNAASGISKASKFVRRQTHPGKG